MDTCVQRLARNFLKLQSIVALFPAHANLEFRTTGWYLYVVYDICRPLLGVDRVFLHVLHLPGYHG